MLTWTDAEDYATLRSADLAAGLSDDEVELMDIEAEYAATRPSLARWLRTTLLGSPATIETRLTDTGDEAVREGELGSYLR